MQVMDFVSALTTFTLPSVFNPYRDVCSQFDCASSPRIRRENLFELLNSAMKASVNSLWIGRDLGYRGGRRTGLALTDEVHLTLAASRFGAKNIRKATKGPEMAERTAREIWKAAIKVTPSPFFWNAFPFHPHEETNPLSNRCHTRKEYSVSKEILSTLLEILSPQYVVAIGQDAAAALRDLGVSHKCVRHPSYGGQNQFLRQVEEIYGLQTTSLPMRQEGSSLGLLDR
jgi:hypothetical protein